MNFKRRDFLRMGTAGVAGGLVSSELVFGQGTDKDEKKPERPAELKSGTGSLHLFLKLKAGLLDMVFDDASFGKDHALVARGTFRKSNGDTITLYRSLFSVESSQQVFACIGDDAHRTSVLLARTEDSNIESLTVWNDEEAPRSYRIDKQKFLDAARENKGLPPKPADYIVDATGGVPNLQGSRPKLEISPGELEEALENSRDYLLFRRGTRPPRQHASMLEFECGFLEIVLSLLFGVDWDSGQ